MAGLRTREGKRERRRSICRQYEACQCNWSSQESISLLSPKKEYALQSSSCRNFFSSQRQHQSEEKVNFLLCVALWSKFYVMRHSVVKILCYASQCGQNFMFMRHNLVKISFCASQSGQTFMLCVTIWSKFYVMRHNLVKIPNKARHQDSKTHLREPASV